LKRGSKREVKLGKECKIYYMTVVEEQTERWSDVGSHSIEPVKVEGREPLGKQPEFCCPELKAEIDKYNIGFFYRLGKKVGLQFPHSPGKNIRFCPFCGAKIVFKEHLKLKVIETPITRHQYHYEVVGENS